jgi:hypothetical protein
MSEISDEIIRRNQPEKWEGILPTDTITLTVANFETKYVSRQAFDAQAARINDLESNIIEADAQYSGGPQPIAAAELALVRMASYGRQALDECEQSKRRITALEHDLDLYQDVHVQNEVYCIGLTNQVKAIKSTLLAIEAEVIKGRDNAAISLANIGDMIDAVLPPEADNERT